MKQANDLLQSQFVHFLETNTKRELGRGWYERFLTRHDLRNKEEMEMKRRLNRPNVFCMAMSYPDIPGSISAKLLKKNPGVDSAIWTNIQQGKQNKYVFPLFAP